MYQDRAAVAVDAGTDATRGAALAPDAVAAARDAGLRYVSDVTPGITRRRHGAGFVYDGPDGRRVRDRTVLARIRGLVVPPAWTAVWICPRPDGHIQAVGRDARGRKQYRYHAEWRQVRDADKYDRLRLFADRLPAIRRAVERDLARRGLPREKVLALVVRLLETTAMRVGNEEYARNNGSFGLTTLRNRHALASATTVRFRFRGKSGRAHEIAVSDRRVARMIKQCQEVPGQELFQYLTDQGDVASIGSVDVNAYLRAVSGCDFTAKDFRTWTGTVAAAAALADLPVPPSAAAAKRAVREVIVQVAHRLGNTPAVCRKCYVHPLVIERFGAGRLPTLTGGTRPRALSAAERRVRALLAAATPSR